MKIVQSLEESSLLIKGVSEAIENGAKGVSETIENGAKGVSKTIKN